MAVACAIGVNRLTDPSMFHVEQTKFAPKVQDVPRGTKSPLQLGAPL